MASILGVKTGCRWLLFQKHFQLKSIAIHLRSDELDFYRFLGLSAHPREILGFAWGS
jgi:hypothetical protein